MNTQNNNYPKQPVQGGNPYGNLYQGTPNGKPNYPPLVSIKRFDFIALFILSLLTGGLYFLYAISIISQTNNEIAVRLGKKKIMGIVTVIAISVLVVMIFGIVLIFSQNAGSSFVSVLGTIGIVLAVIASLVMVLVWYYLFCRQQCEILQSYNLKPNPTASPALLFLIGFVPIYSYYVLCNNYNTGVYGYETELKRESS